MTITEPNLIILSGGKTMGHITPLIAIYESLKEKYDFLYIGLKNSMEEEVCKRKQIPFMGLELFPFYRRKIYRNFKTLKHIMMEKKKIINNIKKDDIKAVFTSGGFVSIPVILAFKNSRFKKYLLEANAVMGLANNYLKRYVDEVITQFPIKASFLNYGYPVYINKSTFDCHFFYQSKPLILVLGGSNGALELVKYAYKLHIDFPQFNFLILTGRYYLKLYEFNANALVYEKINDVAGIFKHCDLIISRAGGATIAEIIETNSKAILIPSRNVTNDHQYKNAHYLNEKQLIKMALSYEELVNLIPEVLNGKVHDYECFSNNAIDKIINVLK